MDNAIIVLSNEEVIRYTDKELNKAIGIRGDGLTVVIDKGMGTTGELTKTLDNLRANEDIEMIWL